MPQNPIHWITATARRSDAESLCAYEQAGCRLSAETDERLDALWIAGMQEWAVVIHPRPLSLDEAEAELALRGRKPPQDRVGPEIAAIIAGTGRLLEAQPHENVRSVLAKAMVGVAE